MLEKQDHVSAINKLRLANKNRWYTYSTDTFQLKAFGTWVQVFRTHAFKDSGPSDCTVGEFKSYLLSVIPETQPAHEGT